MPGLDATLVEAPYDSGHFSRRMGRSARIGLTALVAASGLVGQPSEPVVVSNDEHEVRIVRVAKTNSLHGGMVLPPSTDEAFLLAYLETDDPCFDPARNLGCFEGERDELETLARACGEVGLGDGEVRPADGGGLLEGELACSYLVPADSKAMKLRLRGYPEIEIAPE